MIKICYMHALDLKELMTIFYIFKKWKIGYRHGDICAIVKIRERRLMKTFSC